MLYSKPRGKGQGFIKPVICCKQYNLLEEVKTQERISLTPITSFRGVLNATKVLKLSGQTGPKDTATFFALS